MSHIELKLLRNIFGLKAELVKHIKSNKSKKSQLKVLEKQSMIKLIKIK
jgi:hypothetical protein